MASEPEIVGVNVINDVLALHLQILADREEQKEGDDQDLWVGRQGFIMKLELTAPGDAPTGMYFELFDVNGEVTIKVPPLTAG
ncbi:MAG: hypothetical protein ACRDWA_02430 [Acidimicrobiia bacterium]